MDMVLGWCRQAYDSHVLVGDLCQAQVRALDYAKSKEMKFSISRLETLQKQLGNMMDTWVALEHNDLWKARQGEKASKAQAEADDATTIDADTMDELRMKMLKI